MGPKEQQRLGPRCVGTLLCHLTPGAHLHNRSVILAQMPAHRAKPYSCVSLCREVGDILQEIPCNFIGKEAVTGEGELCSSQTRWQQALALPLVDLTTLRTGKPAPPSVERATGSALARPARGAGLFGALGTGSAHLR